jgi:3',5'-cyclic AMP phosphodiesterase CpdA
VESSRRPPGELLARVATVNDLHFGETVCGVLEGVDVGPLLESEPGGDPYPTVMNRAAVMEIAAISPSAVVAKGDLTSTGTAAEYAEFEALYRPAFADRLVVTAGNHDRPARGSGVPDVPAGQAVEIPGTTIAVLDTARPGRPGGEVSEEQADWLDELAARADRPVLVFGHHPAGGDDMIRLFGPRAGHATCLDPASTQRLIRVVTRRPAVVGYFAGHTHRNKVRHLEPTGSFPWVEVACVKDFPGSWAEYRIYEGGILQVHHRISSDAAAWSWSERCRSMFAGHYPSYALGDEPDRCFEIPIPA